MLSDIITDFRATFVYTNRIMNGFLTQLFDFFIYVIFQTVKPAKYRLKKWWCPKMPGWTDRREELGGTLRTWQEEAVESRKHHQQQEQW